MLLNVLLPNTTHVLFPIGSTNPGMWSDLCNNINSRLKGAVDRELGGKYTEKKTYFLIFDIFAKQANFIVRFLRIHPVQSVVNNIAQLSGRGFPRIFPMRSFSSQLYVFLVLQN